MCNKMNYFFILNFCKKGIYSRLVNVFICQPQAKFKIIQMQNLQRDSSYENKNKLSLNCVLLATRGKRRLGPTEQATSSKLSIM